MAWYKDGLRFSCTQCGACCSGKPGARVAVDAYELARLEERIGSPLATEQRRGCQTLVLTISGDCPLLGPVCSGKRLCSVYGQRPRSCCTPWPFVRRHLDSPAAWVRASESCPGMNSGELHSRDRIEAMLRGPSD